MPKLATPLIRTTFPRPHALRFVSPLEWGPALSETLPICLAYFTIAIAFGLSAKETGVPVSVALGMSFFVYAGASQMIAVGLLAAGEPLSAIVFTTLIVNIRFLLLSTSIATRLQSWSGFQKVLFTSIMSDETFTLLSSHRELNLSFSHSMRVQIIAWSSWFLGTLVGVEFSGLVMDPKPFGLDFALIGLLLGMSCLVIKNSIQFTVAAFSGAVALIAMQLGFGTWGIPIAAIAGPSLGVWLEKRWILRAV